MACTVALYKLHVSIPEAKKGLRKMSHFGQLLFGRVAGSYATIAFIVSIHLFLLFPPSSFLTPSSFPLPFSAPPLLLCSSLARPLSPAVVYRLQQIVAPQPSPALRFTADVAHSAFKQLMINYANVGFMVRLPCCTVQYSTLQ